MASGAGGARTHDRRIMRSTAPTLRMRYLHRYHQAVPPMALIALLARVARSTNRSTPDYGDHRCRSQNVARVSIGENYGRRAMWSIWTARRSSSIV